MGSSDFEVQSKDESIFPSYLRAEVIMNGKVISAWLATLFCMGTLISDLRAQIDKAVVVGRIQDTSGAIIIDAEVQMKRLSTNEVFRTITTDSGDYTLVNLQIDTYEIRASMTGFKSEVRTGITLEIGRTYRIDFQLSVGEVTETVQVTSEAPILKTESPELGQVIDNQKVVGLPIRSRDFMGFISLIPGAAPSRGSYGGGGLANTGFNIAGQRRTDNMMYMDGGIVTEGNGATTFFPSLDALQEVEVKTGLYSAEFGIKPGGQISTITKSGTNKPHGTLFEFHRNDNLSARNFFDRANIPEFKNNLFGATLGGPLFIPRVFNGKDRAWFFLSYSGERRRRVRSLTGVVPTAEEKNGRFTSTITDPLTNLPFPNNTIPSNRFNPVSLKLLPFWPDPNTTGRGFNFTSPNSSDNFDANQFIAKVDLKQSDVSRWSGSFVFDSLPNVATNAIEAFSLNDPLHTWRGSLTNTRSIRGTVINDFSVHYFLRAFTVSTIVRPGFGASLGIPNLNYVDRDGVPTTSVTGFLSLGDRTIVGPVNIGSWEIRDNLSFNKGAHSFKTGFHGRRHFNLEALIRRSSFSFTSRYTGNAFADFLLGLPTQTNQGAESNRSHVIQNSMHFYFQDSWKATSKLTLNLGLRYEYRAPWKDKRGFATNFNPVTASLDPPLQNLTLQPWETGRFEKDVPLISWNKKGILPRVGLAYRLTDKTVIRAGYGAYANEPVYAVIESFGTNPRPNAQIRTFISDLTTPTISLSDPFNIATAGGGLPNATGAQSLFPQSLTHSYGLSIQHELSPKTVLEIAYQGSNGVHDPVVNEFNDAVPGTGPRQQRRPYPGFQSIRFTTAEGTNNVHGMNVRVERKLGPEGLSALLAYTWTKAIDTVGGRLPIPGDPGFQSRNTSLKQNRGLGEGNIPGRLALTVGYEVPFGAGKPFLTDNPLGKIIGGWTFYGFLALQSGPFITPVIPIDRLDTGSTASSRPDVIRNPNLPESERIPVRWFDTGAFLLPRPFIYGNAGRSIIQAPGIANLDLAILRSFRTSESSRLEFRFEAFNATNHTNFREPNASFGTSTFGVITSALDSREIQLGIKFYF